MNIRKTYGARTVLDMKTPEFESGKIYAVIGANGSGKSTLAKILAGIEKTDDGHRGKDCFRICRDPQTGDRETKEQAVTEIGYLPQKSYGFRMSVLKNVMLKNKDEAQAEQLLEVLGMKDLIHAKAAGLSGGETQKMALARVLMENYGLLILDEPTSAMDMESTLAAEELIRKCGSKVLLITHSIAQAERLGDEIWYLENGKLIEAGPADQVLHRTREPQTAKFLKFYGKSC